MPAAVSFREFSWRHAGRKHPTLEGVNLEIGQGEKVLLLGESGSGKSTLLAALAGVLGNDEGEQHGQVLVHAHPSATTRGVVGLVLQDPDSQVICSRVGDDVVFGCENLGVEQSEMWRRAARALDLVGLTLPLDHPTTRLSGGQKQRLALAGVIAMGAQVIVLDEPTANLDPEGVREVRDAVARVVEETNATLIVVEHRVETWCDVVDRLVVLGTEERGIVADGAPDIVLKNHGQQLADRGVWIPTIKVEVDPLKPQLGTEYAIEAINLSVGWDGIPVGLARTAQLPFGQSTVITGPNGAGKTTLGLSLAGLLKPISGHVRAHKSIAGGISGNPQDWSSAQLTSRIGFVFQDPEHQFLGRTVREELLLGPQMLHSTGGGWFRRKGQATPEETARVEELLHKLRLDHLAEAHPFSLSGGQKRRLSVATALVCAPRTIIMDEPTFGQDRRTFIELVTLFQELLQQGVTLAAITHDELFIRIMGQHHIKVS